jgi:hypothetical protein
VRTPVLSRARLAAALALPLLLACFHWQLLWGPRAVWFASDDNAYQVLPWLEMQARAWRSGQAPLWDPWQYMGQPLIGQGQPAAASPLNWLLAAKPEGAAGWLYLNIYFLLIRWIGAAGMYRLARSLRCGRPGSVLAGFAYAAVGEFACAMRPQMAMGAMWAPWALRFLLKSAGLAPRTPGALLRSSSAALTDGASAGPLRHAVLGGFFLGLCWLGGHPQMPLFLSLGFALLWAVALLSGARRAAGAAVFFSTALLAGAVQLLPLVEYGRRAVRWVGAAAPIGWNDKIPLEIHRQFSLKVESIPAVVVPGYHGEFQAYHGALLLLLAAFGAWALRRGAGGPLAALGLCGFWLALGPAGGLHKVLYRAAPHFDKARAPEAALILLSLSVPALAAAGAEALFRIEGAAKKRAAGLLAVAGVAAGVWVWRHAPVFNLAWWSVFGAVAIAALIRLGGLRKVPAWGALLVAVAAASLETAPLRERLFPAVSSPEASRYLRMLAAHRDIAAWLRARGGHWRVEVDDTEIPYNFGDWHGLQQHQGYLAGVTENIYRHELHTDHAKRLFGVRFRVALSPSDSHPAEVFRGASGVRVYESEAPLPRVFIVHAATGLDNRLHAAGALHAIRERIGETTFLPGPVPELQNCRGREQARILDYGINRVTVEATLGCRGMLILTDAWFPGWRAAAGGRALRIHEAYAAVRGVVLEPGTHRVEFVYRPASVIAGGALTALACLIAAACARRRGLH